jgi:TonB family protein
MKRTSPLTVSVVYLLVAVLLCAAAPKELHAVGTKPVIYIYVGKGSERRGEVVKSVYGGKFRIVELTDDRGYTRSRATAPVIPRPLYESGQMLYGDVRLIFIVTEKGRVIEPFVLTSTNKKLNRTLLDIILQWRGTPARLNGVPISTVLAQDFSFAR